MILVIFLQCIGLQDDSNPRTWVLGQDLQVCLESGIAKKVQKDQALYEVLGEVNDNELPIFGHIGRLQYVLDLCII